MPKYEVVMLRSSEDNVFVVFAPELAGCTAHGETREETLQNVQEAMRHWIDMARESDKPVPRSKGERLKFWPDVAGKSTNPATVA